MKDFSEITDIASVLVSIGALCVAWFQLTRLNKSINASNLIAIFEIEFELNRRKERLSEIRRSNEEALNNIRIENIPVEASELAIILEGYRKEAYENYLNIFDRLCYFILKDKFDEEDFRLDYRNMLFDTVERDEEDYFRNQSKYRNMLKLYNKWKDK